MVSMKNQKPLSSSGFFIHGKSIYIPHSVLGNRFALGIHSNNLNME